MKLLLITLLLLGLGIAGIAIKIWAKKDGKFAGTCASQNPMLNKDGDAVYIDVPLRFWSRDVLTLSKNEEGVWSAK